MSAPRGSRVRVVGIGGSAGALQTLRPILQTLSPHTGMAFVIILHISPDRPSNLAAVLGRWTNMPVSVATQGLILLPDHVYVIAPSTDLILENDRLAITSPRTFINRHHQVDRFLTSLARERGPEAVGVILSGGDGDGTRGCRDIFAEGGIMIVQDDTALIPDMPRRAENTGCTQYSLPAESIARKLSEIAAIENDGRGR